MGSVVARWTGREARALREAKRMTVREFAAHLGVNDAAVSKWEHRGVEAKLRNETQQLLDTDLTRSEPEVAHRFELILHSESTGAPSPPEQQHATRPPQRPPLGERSRKRTTALLTAGETAAAEDNYWPNRTAIECFQQFLASPARVFVLTGRAGSGKTTLTRYWAHNCSDQVDFQFHTCSVWSLASADIAAEILRYASLGSGNEALLSLEHASETLERSCIVVVDGVDSDDQLITIGRQVDGILRQANSPYLRFVIVARTPPELDLSAYPILAAATFGQTGTPGTASYTLAVWTLAEARDLWNRERSEPDVPFAALPESLQSLARTPLYMHMLRSAGDLTQAIPVGAAFHLVDHCVRRILTGVQSVEAAVRHFARIACELMPDAVPETLSGMISASDSLSSAEIGRVSIPFVEQAPDGSTRFTHDVFGEYFLAVRIVDQMTARGRSAATIAGFNELAAHAARSAAARGVFDFVVCALESLAPNLVEMIAAAPSITLDAALPMLLETAAAQGIPASADVVRICARRCAQTPTRQLARALLATPNLADALGDQHPTWIAEHLRTYGSEIWDDIARHIEQALDIRISTRIVDCLDLDRAEEAAFLARHVDLFTSSGHGDNDLLHQLLFHLDWRVRAGLAEALSKRPVLGRAHVDRVVDHLVRDDDYKVRAAIARAIGGLDTPNAAIHLRVLLTDRNWHVRERALQGVLTGNRAPLPAHPLATTVISTTASDPSWTAPPVSAAKLLTRIQLLTSASTLDTPPLVDVALFGLLREIRSGWIDLPNDLEHTLITLGETSSHWLTVREATATRQRRAPQEGATSIHECYRRRRGHRSLQIALDVHSLDRGMTITAEAVKAGVDLIEIGDPLIKRTGVDAITAIKRAAPETAVVAEMMSADWGRDQVELAAEAGADIVLLIGPASIASVSAAATAARRLGVALVLDAPPAQVDTAWVRDMERAGIDGFVVTTNIDLGVAVNHPLATARTIRTCSQLPVAVSGGFSTADDALLSSGDWDIAIVGRSVADAVTPADIAYQLTGITRKIHAKERP
ncbi:orotidine 5'-phosphate decarboxylase / HUMPS family protein [Nocardia terpenica]|uniref:HTH cro/C1-type domain-containing protein n=1 Tax=Nocardia terpenica TaxID=455432 RepID=A0A291RRT8_9NOCA|nr:orotidine 5'-phosphate decarboxylase / HUMPS family protein [Nocardia terpenica]ATL70055.1 hypothetical protein CRH09_31580 [Nocardia terpenica]